MNVAVIGLGKLGLPLACLHAEESHVFGIDLNAKTVHSINECECPLKEPGLERLMRTVVRDKKLTAHRDYTVIKDCDASLIIVPTPSLPNNAFDDSLVIQACTGIGNAIRHRTGRHLVVVCSTVMPGTCTTRVRETLEKTSGRTVGGDDLGLVYSPEFIALGSVIEDMKFPDMILIGESDPASGKEYEALARKVANVAPVRPSAFHMSLTSAEIAKISVNSYVTMKISFANALAELCENYPGADANIIANAMGHDRRIGRSYLKPGVAFGGPCFPRDNRALQYAAEQVGITLPLAAATDAVNERQIATMVDRIKSYGRPQVGILGLSYKPCTAVTEESFGVQLAIACHEAGYKVTVYDPLVKEQPGLFPEGIGWQVLPAELISNETLTVLCTPDPKFESLFPTQFSTPQKYAALVLDCWNMIEPGPWDDTNVIKLGRHNVP